MAFAYDDVYKLCENKYILINWLREKEWIGNLQGASCEICRLGKLRLQEDKSFSQDGIYWRCSYRGCGKKMSIRKGSWFAKSHLSLAKITKLTYYWVWKYSEELIRHELKIGSSHTAVDWYNFAREVCVDILETNSEQIGGPGEIIEIDESKFGKRKYHRGKRVEGVWVFGGIERSSKKYFMQCVTDRSAATLIPIIIWHVKPGTTIMSDCRKAYLKLDEEGYLHLIVNHSIQFKDNETGACTNTIEATWGAVKRSLPRYGTKKDMYDTYFAEYCIRKQYLNSSSDKFLAFLELVRKIYPTKQHVIVRQPRQPLAAMNASSNSLDDFQVN